MFIHRFRAVCLTLAWILVAGCGSDAQRDDQDQTAASAESTQAHAGGRLVIGVQQEPERLSEVLNATATTNLICNLIFSKFVKYDDELNLLPDLIEEIPTVENGGISEDHLRYTYHLRSDATWHDGTPVTSGDVEFTYHVIMTPDIPVESREGWSRVESVETPDATTVVFTLSEPYPDFVAETFLDEAVLPWHLLSGMPSDEFHLSDFHRAPVGSGPFIFLSLAGNPGYYGEGPYLDEIIFKFIPDENALLVQLKTGEIDLYDNANLTFLDEEISGVRVYSTPTMMYEHLDLNNEHPILGDRRVRRAIAYATNAKEITEQVYHGWMQVAPLDEHPSSKFFNATAASAMVYDPPQARRLLRDAGWADSDGDGILDKDGEKLSLTISATAGNADREKTELVLQKQYREVGIDLQIKNHNATVLYGSYEDGGVLKRGTFDIAMYAWLSSPEPATKRGLYASDNIPPNGQNHPRIRHEQLTELLDRAATEVDVATRIHLYHRASDILVQEMPVIPLFWYTTADLCNASLRNYKPNPTQSSDTWNANTWHFGPAGPALSAR
jgi:peptide/nickel transport system substrate-binding protein